MIIVRLEGGLGNQMFQYAFGRYYSVVKNAELKADITHLTARYKSKRKVFRTFDLDIFDADVKIASTREILQFVMPRSNNKYVYHLLDKLYRRKNTVFEKKQLQFDSEVYTNGTNEYFAGYWQSYKYFHEINDIIVRDFTIKYPLLQESMDLYHRIVNTESVCLNFRRTDYLSDPMLNTLNGINGEKYYKNAIDTICGRISNPTFFVFSDDIPWCKNNVVTGHETVFIDHDHAGVKYSNYLRLMTACKNFIIPNSSFGWWAAWLSANADKIVIVPDTWNNAVKLHQDDLIPSSWIRLVI